MKKTLLLTLVILLSLCAVVGCSSSKDNSDIEKENQIVTEAQDDEKNHIKEDKEDKKDKDDGSNEDNDEETEEKEDENINYSENDKEEIEYVEENEAEEDNNDSQQEVAFMLPADKYTDLDLSKSDPSTKDIVFACDNENKVTACSYKVSGNEYIVSYTYNSDVVEVFVFSSEGDIMAYEIFNYTPDSSEGFSTHRGYFFSGVTVK